MKIKLTAAFLGLKFLPHPLTIGFNNINPKLILNESEIEFKNVFFTRTLSYSNIENVDVFQAFMTQNIIIKPVNTVFTHSFNIKDKEQFKSVLQFLSDKNCQLSDKALKALFQ